MIGADIARVATTSALAIAFTADRPSPVMAVALLALTSGFTAVFDPAYAAVVPLVVETSDLAAANGMNMANSAAGGVLGPVIGGSLLGVFSPTVVLAINSLTFAWSAAVIARVAKLSVAATDERDHGANLASIRSVLRSSGLWRLIGLAAMLNMVLAPMTLLMVELAVHSLNTSSFGFGVLEMSIAAGVLVGALAATKVASWPLMWPLLALGSLIAAAGSLDYLPTVVVFVAIGIAAAVINTLTMLRFQRTIPAEYHGRAFGLAGALSEALRPVGILLAGPMLAATTVSKSFVLVGATTVVCSLVLVPGLAKMPDEG